MGRLVIYVHGKGGNANEAEHYKHLFPENDVIGFDYQSQNPWKAKDYCICKENKCFSYDYAGWNHASWHVHFVSYLL